MWQESSWSSGF
jgi:hypothetical protein